MTIAWIGLGNMGGPMAANLVNAGHRVRGFDLSAHAMEMAEAAGIELGSSIPDAVAGAEIVFTMLPKGEHVRSVLEGPEGILANVDANTLIVDSSTIDIETARDFHALVTKAGFRFLDAPVSGGVSGAAAGTLTFMIGGAEPDLTQAKPFIEIMAGRVFHTGGPGNGQAAKIVNNMMLGVALAATCEGAVLAERLGLDAGIFQSLATASSGDSWALRTWYPVAGVVDSAAVNRDFEGGFSTTLLHKDLGLALAAGESTKTPLDFATAAHARMAALIDDGYGNKDCSILVKRVDGTLGKS